MERRAEWIHPVADQTSGSRAFLVSPLRRVSIIRGRGQSLPYGTVVDGTVPLPSSPTALGLNQKLPIMGSGEEEGACSLDPAGPCPSPVSADKCEQVCGCPSFSLYRSQRSSVKGKTRSERERERKSDRGRRGGVERARRSRRLGEQNKGPRATDTYIKGRRTDGQTHTETLQREREREREESWGRLRKRFPRRETHGGDARCREEVLVDTRCSMFSPRWSRIGRPPTWASMEARLRLAPRPR